MTKAKQKSTMSLAQHFRELRKRFVVCAVAIALGAILGWLVSDVVWQGLTDPVTRLAKSAHKNTHINYTNLTGAFDLKLQIAVYTGIILSAPVWLYQIFAFLVPGLTKKEKKFTFAFFFSAVPLFFLGCIAAWFILPNIVHLLGGFTPKDDSAFYDAKQYFDFVLKLVVAVGIAFVLPVFIVLLNFAGILSAKTIIASWRGAILIIMLFSALATPAADIISMIMLAIPMVILYFLAWYISFVHDKARVKREQKMWEETAENV